MQKHSPFAFKLIYYLSALSPAQIVSVKLETHYTGNTSYQVILVYGKLLRTMLFYGMEML